MAKIAYDTVLKRPGCVLIQAALGGDIHLTSEFETKYWLLAPTPDMRVFEVTPEQMKKLIKITEQGAIL
jgi:hypothetical protein